MSTLVFTQLIEWDDLIAKNAVFNQNLINSSISLNRQVPSHC